MARINYDTFQETAAAISESGDGIKMFNLKNDGDEAIVRILHDSIDDFDILTTHSIKIGEKFRKISCIRDPREPIDNCPLCKTNVKIQQRFFIHMLVYTKDNTGNIICTPMVWERNANEFAKKFKTLIDEYGPLSESVFKIKRNGKAGSMDTTYEILYCNPSIYTAQLYPINKDAFTNYDTLGRIVLDKTFDEIVTYLNTGNFPQTNNTNNNSPETMPTPVQAAPAPVTGGYASPAPSAPVTPPPFTPPYTSAPTAPIPSAPAETPNYGGPAYGTGAPAGRPTRYY